MARTIASAVKHVLRKGTEGGDYDDVNEPDLSPYIDAASIVVTRVAACAVAKNKTLSAAELEIVERWLSAHFYAMSDQTYASSNTQGASASYHGQTGMNLDATKYGQTAQTLDFSGCLVAISKRRTAGGFWLGKPPSEQTDYVDRN